LGPERERRAFFERRRLCRDTPPLKCGEQQIRQKPPPILGAYKAKIASPGFGVRIRGLLRREKNVSE